MNQKKISIIIATYNCGQKVEKTIKSILSQNGDLFELIIVDGASTDDTLNYINKYKDHLTMVSEKDGGVYYAFNKALDIATGKYLYFIGAGDCLRDGVLEKVSEYLTDDSSPSFVYGDVFMVRQQTYQTGERSKLNLVSNPFCHQCIFYHYKIFERLGKYDLKYKILSDSAYNLKCFGDLEIRKQYVPYVIADYEGGGLSDTIEDYEYTKDFPRLVRKNLGMRPYVSFVMFADLYFTVYKPYLRSYVRPIMLSIKDLKSKHLKFKSGKFRQRVKALKFFSRH